MGDGFSVEAEQIRAHARNVEAIRGRFGAIKAASGHISGDESAYGLLCGWISGVLEARHAQQDELVAYVEENLSLVVSGLERTAAQYEAVEADAAQAMATISRRLESP